VPDKTELGAPIEALRDLVIANRILASKKILDAFGHVSIRHPADPQRFIMSRSRGPALVRVEDLMEFTLDCEPVDQRGRAMYAERQIHGAIYRARPDVGAVCHHHANSLIPFGVTNAQLRPIFHMASTIGTKVPVWDIREDFGDTNLLVTKSDQGDSLARALGPNRVVLMRGHGAAVASKTVREVVFTSIYMQVNAELVMAARNLGEIRFLSDGEIAQASEMLFSPLSQERSWQTWVSEAGFDGL
jgi:ribulose-5-phosphate 4-epimerase/fuculose-1-phosphate aldolase